MAVRKNQYAKAPALQQRETKGMRKENSALFFQTVDDVLAYYTKEVIEAPDQTH